MPIDPNMGFENPTPLVTPGPDYAVDVSAALTTIGFHNHQPGSGVGLSITAVTIDADLPMNQNNVNEARSVRMHNNPSLLSGGSDLNELYVFSGDLYFNNSAGTPVKITNVAQVNSSATALQRLAISSNITISPSDNYNIFDVSTTSSAIVITLPAVSAVAAGRFYYIKDTHGNAQVNNITLVRSGSDTFDFVNANRVMSANYGGWLIVGDGTSNWDIFYYSTKSMMEDGRFGTDLQNILLKGLSATLSAVGSNTVTVGAPSNIVAIGGAQLNVGSTTSMTVNVPIINIGQGANIINLGNNPSGQINVANNSTFTRPVFIDTTSLTATGNVTLCQHGGIVNVNGYTTFNDDVLVNSLGGTNHEFQIANSTAAKIYSTSINLGQTSVDTLLVASTTVHASPVIFNNSSTVTMQGTCTINNTHIVNGASTFNGTSNFVGQATLANPLINLTNSSGGIRYFTSIGPNGNSTFSPNNDQNVVIPSGAGLTAARNYTLTSTGNTIGQTITFIMLNSTWVIFLNYLAGSIQLSAASGGYCCVTLMWINDSFTGSNRWAIVSTGVQP